MGEELASPRVDARASAEIPPNKVGTNGLAQIKRFLLRGGFCLSA